MEVRFVASYDSTTGRPNRRSKDERAHSARIVRQRKKQQQQRRLLQDSSNAKCGDGFSNSFSNEFVLIPSKPVDVKVTELVEIEQDGEVVGYEECDSRRGSWDDVDDGDGLDDMDCSNSTSVSPTTALAYPNKTSTSLSPTLSPVFGALRTSTFDHSNSSLAADAARYYLQCVMGNTILPSHQRTWFEAFCKDDMVFHCLMYCSYFFQDVKRLGGGEGVLREATLRHRVKALRLLGERVKELGERGEGNGRIEALVLTMTSLWMWSRERDGEGGKGRIGTGALIGSSASMPDAWLKDAFAIVAVEDSHARALEWLVRRAGGLESVGKMLPGLRTGLASCDILSASANATKPRFPSIWENDIDNSVIAFLEPLCPTPSLDDNAFANSVPNNLPKPLLRTLNSVRHLITALSFPQTPPLTLMRERNAIQHRLLSLPSWTQLKADQQTEKSFLATFETCRLTAILFTNAVFFPIERSVTWRVKLLGQLRGILEVANFGAWKGEGGWRLLIWSLVIANLTASEIDQQQYFLQSLQRTLHTKCGNVMGWNELQILLRTYLWCESVCNPGLNVLWLSLLDSWT